MASSRGTWLYRAERFDVALQLLFNRGKAAEIEQWLVQVSGTHPILPMDGAAFRCWEPHQDPNNAVHSNRSWLASRRCRRSVIMLARCSASSATPQKRAEPQVCSQGKPRK